MRDEKEKRQVRQRRRSYKKIAEEGVEGGEQRNKMRWQK